MALETFGKATARGRLEKTPFGHVLIYCQQRGLSGSLVIHLGGAQGAGPDGPDAPPDAVLRVVGGAVVAARVDWPAASLPDALSDLCAQLRGHYAFFGGRDLRDPADDTLEGHVDARAAVAHALRRGDYPQEPIDCVLSGLRGQRVAAGPELSLDAYDLTDAERAWVQAIAAPLPVEQLLADTDGVCDPARLLYLLRATRGLTVEQAHLGAGEAAGASDAANARSSGAVPAHVRPEREHDFEPDSEVIEVEGLPSPAGLDRALCAHWQEIQTRYRRLPHDDCFRVLDLARDARCAAARAAHATLSPRFDPTLLPAPLAPLSGQASAVHARMLQALETLGTPASRLAYLCDIDAGGGTPAAPHGLHRVWEPARHLQEASALLARREIDDALHHAERALAADSLAPEALGLHAYLRFLASQRTPIDAAATLGVLERAVRARPLAAGLHYYLGTVLKHAGYDGKADTHLRHASLIPPPMARPRAHSATVEVPPERDPVHEDLTRRARETTGRLFGKLG